MSKIEELLSQLNLTGIYPEEPPKGVVAATSNGDGYCECGSLCECDCDCSYCPCSPK